MKPLSLFLFIFLASCPSLARAQATFTLLGVKYDLDNVTITADGGILNEYVPEGESAYAWKNTYLAVRQFPKGTQAKTVGHTWIELIHKMLVKPLQVFKSKTQGEYIFEAWLGSPTNTYIEIDLYRLLTESDGTVVSYQFAQKITASNQGSLFGKKTIQFNPEAYTKNREALFKAVGALNLPVVRKRS